MEIWIIYALVSMFVTGIFNFGFKIISKRNYNTSFVAIIQYSSAGFLALMYYLYSHGLHIPDINATFLILTFAIGNTIFYFLSTLSRVEALHNIDTTIFFPLYKTLFPILLTLFSYFYLQESLTIPEFIGILLGISVPLLLITKTENQIQKNLKLGIILVIITSVFAGISAVFNKFISELSLDKDLFIVLALFSGTIIGTISYRYFQKETGKTYSRKGIYLFSCILGILQFLGFITFTYAMEGNLAIVITLNSFSILIPIILSVIFYKEEMTLKKALVVFLSLVSILLFI